MARLERANAGVKVLCLTTWRHPKVEKCRGPGRARSPVLWGGIWGSNPRHPEPQSGALPTELIPPYFPSLQALARQEGLEPPAYCLEGSCSIRLSYWRRSVPSVWLERVKGIEPSYPAWKAGILPLNYTRRLKHNTIRKGGCQYLFCENSGPPGEKKRLGGLQ